MFKKNLIAAIVSIAGFACHNALALPFVDGSTGIQTLIAGEDSSGNSIDTMLFNGTEVDGDENTIYVPWDRLQVVNDERGVPKFTFNYAPQGALVVATVKASYSNPDKIGLLAAAQQARADELGVRASDIKIAPLPVKSGVYSFVLDAFGTEFVMAQSPLKNDIPSNEVALGVYLTNDAADLVAMSLQSPSTALAWNYKYDFPARTTPYNARVKIDWKSVYSYVRTQFGFAHIAGTFQMDQIVRKLEERKTIEILVVEGDVDSSIYDQMISDITKIVIARVFKAHHPEPGTQQMQLPKAQNRWVPNFILGRGTPGTPTRGWNVGLSAAFSLQKIDSSEQITETFDITAHPYQVRTGVASVQVPSYCNRYPQMYHYRGDLNPFTNKYVIEEGCPDEVYGSGDGATMTIPEGGVSYGAVGGEEQDQAEQDHDDGNISNSEGALEGQLESDTGFDFDWGL